MEWKVYEKEFIIKATQQGLSTDQQQKCLEYARALDEKSLPIIFDQEHLALLIGIDNAYLHAMTNSSYLFYRTFYIEKRNGKPRRIDEPLPDLKRVQHWILCELLEKIQCSKYAKAYVSGLSIKHNVRFHRKQKLVVTLDVKNFFPSIKSGRILNIFLKCGYTLPVAVMLTELCCLHNHLPQGAPTSPLLSNLVMIPFDDEMGKYCFSRKIRFTRYADDLTFSGDIDISSLIYHVDLTLKYLGLMRNTSKSKIMRSNNRQIVTGVVVNELMQVPKSYRKTIRQEVYYINKFGLDDHILHINEQRAKYIQHLAGKIQYALFINPKDYEMKKYLEVLNPYLHKMRDSE